MIDTPAVRRRQVPAVTRAVAILRHLGRASEPIGVNRLARELELVPSTCLHILRALMEEGLVDFDHHTKRYTLGIGILAIARGAIVRNTFASLVEPRLTELSRSFGGTALATQLADTEHMVVVALSRVQQPFRLQVDLGSRFPALISATGRCHAAFNLAGMADNELEARFAELHWDHPPRFAAWKREVGQVRKKGYGVDSGAYISGITIIAVPLLDNAGRMTHSIVAIDITERLDPSGAEAVARRMLEIRDGLRELLPDGAVQ